MQICVRTLTCRTMFIDVEPTTTVADLKVAIEKQTDVAPDDQRLIFAGKGMDDSKTISDFLFKSDSVVHLVIRLPVSPWLEVPGDPHAAGTGPKRKRIVREMERMQGEEEHGQKWSVLTSVDEVVETSQMRVKIHGPAASPYEGADFEVLVDFPHDYPFKPFAMRMCTPTYHPLIFFPWAVPPFIKTRVLEAPNTSSQPKEDGQEIIRLHDFFDSKQPGAIALVSEEGLAFGKDLWSPATFSDTAIRALYAMLEVPGRADAMRNRVVRGGFPEYEEWKTKKELHWDRARAAVQCHIMGKWSVQTHRLCLPAFKREVRTFLLFNQRLNTESNDNHGHGLAMELVLEVVNHLWCLHHFMPQLDSPINKQ